MSIGITILGSTGTIGVNTLDVVRRHPDRFHVVALTAHRNVERMFEQCLASRPRYAVMADPRAAGELERQLRNRGLETEVLAGTEGLEQAAGIPEAEQVMAGIVGGAGLAPTLAAARAGKRVLLANKESLVMAGHLFMAEIERAGAELIPIDSEHNAIFQCLPPGFRCGYRAPGVSRILLTASGGPFRETPLNDLTAVTPDMAVRHPNWVMGRKISVDSATMMNKGLELIEASWLFGMPAADLQVVLHPQSVVHSMVEYLDGSVLAQLGQPDMRTPISQAMAYPERITSGVPALDLWETGRLDFGRADFERFPCLAVCLRVLAAAGTAPVVLNAANEIAVEAFLERGMGYLAIAPIIEDCLDRVAGQCDIKAAPDTLDTVMAIDGLARGYAREAVAKRCAT